MSQTTGDLRTLIIRRAGQGRRVVLLSNDSSIAQGIEANKCQVLVDPEGPEALRSFGPDVIVGLDGLVDSGGLAFERLAEAAPGAELIFSCANSGSASSLIAQLSGHEAPRGHSETQVRTWLDAAGYVVDARDRVVVPFEPSGLATDAEAALRALFEQVNPEAAADRWLWVARPGPKKTVFSRTSGLLSAVVFDGPSRELTVAALDRQSQKPIEVVSSVEQASGQFVAFLMPGDLPSRDHFARLVAALQRGLSAWALESNDPPAKALARGAVDCCAYVIDRERLGPFTLTLARGAPSAEAVLFARLAAIFPATLVGGGPSFQRAQRPEPIGEALTALRSRPLRLLLELEELLQRAPDPKLRVLLKHRLQSLIR